MRLIVPDRQPSAASLEHAGSPARRDLAKEMELALDEHCRLMAVIEQDPSVPDRDQMMAGLAKVRDHLVAVVMGGKEEANHLEEMIKDLRESVDRELGIRRAEPSRPARKRRLGPERQGPRPEYLQTVRGAR
jgi:hypothetical protein